MTKKQTEVWRRESVDVEMAKKRRENGRESRINR
jgi:hypothetical protein